MRRNERSLVYLSHLQMHLSCLLYKKQIRTGERCDRDDDDDDDNDDDDDDGGGGGDDDD